MNAYDVLAQQLNAMNASETREWLKTWVSDTSMALGNSMTYGPDSTPALVLARVMKQLTQRAQNQIIMEVGTLLEEFLAQPRVNINYAGNLLRVAEKVHPRGTANTLVEQIDRFSLWDPFAVQIALSIILDARVPQTTEFWFKAQKLNPERFTGFAITGLMRQDIKAATSLLPQSTSSIVALMIDLFYDNMTSSEQKTLLSCVREQLPNCNEATVEQLTEWVNSKN